MKIKLDIIFNNKQAVVIWLETISANVGLSWNTPTYCLTVVTMAAFQSIPSEQKKNIEEEKPTKQKKRQRPWFIHSEIAPASCLGDVPHFNTITDTRIRLEKSSVTKTACRLF